MVIVSLTRPETAPPPLELEQVKCDSLHTMLVQRGARWLKQRGCKIVLSEFSAANEIPDVIGWRDVYGKTYLLEAKSTRGDFLKDKHKPWRRNPSDGMGMFRYYICPPKMIRKEELPDGWGLLYAHARVITLECGVDPRRYGSPDMYTFHERNTLSEQRMLLSALNRIQLQTGAAEFDKLVHATYASKQVGKPSGERRNDQSTPVHIRSGWDASADRAPPISSGGGGQELA
jgi:hypothetical protein